MRAERASVPPTARNFSAIEKRWLSKKSVRRERLARGHLLTAHARCCSLNCHRGSKPARRFMCDSLPGRNGTLQMLGFRRQEAVFLRNVSISHSSIHMFRSLSRHRWRFMVQSCPAATTGSKLKAGRRFTELTLIGTEAYQHESYHPETLLDFLMTATTSGFFASIKK
jgi:hypothetical protein